MEALKLRMPSPMPLPTAANFPGPKSRRAMAIINNQCQGENSPITPPRIVRAFPARRRPRELPVKSLGYGNFGVKAARCNGARRMRIFDAYHRAILKSILEGAGLEVLR